MTDRPRSPLRRISVARTAILVVVVILAVLAFSPLGGPLRILFRGVLALGALALLASYLWPLVRRVWRFRSRG